MSFGLSFFSLILTCVFSSIFIQVITLCGKRRQPGEEKSRSAERVNGHRSADGQTGSVWKGLRSRNQV